MTAHALLIDDRAGSRDLIDYAPLDETGELCRLDSGDVMLFGDGPDSSLVITGVELKSIWDLLSSANTGRLQATQIPAMLDEYDQSWLLFYGDYRPAMRSNALQIAKGSGWRKFRLGRRDVPYGYLEALLVDLAVMGIRIKHVRDMREAAIWIGVLHRWWSKPWSKHHGMRVLDKSHQMGLMPHMDVDMKLRVKVAAQLPGVGFERAMAAAKHFATVSAMINATAAQWQEVDGIGKVIAKAIEEAV